MNNKNHFRTGAISITWLWLGLFALLAFALVLASSVLSHNDQHLLVYTLTIQNYLQVFNPLYLRVFLRSFYLAGVCTLLCLLVGYPFAYFLSQLKSTYKHFLFLLVIIPFWTSSLIRSYAMIAILKAKGLLNTLLLAMGIIHTPLNLLFTNWAVIIGLVYNLLPFMILPLYTNLQRLDKNHIQAAEDLGATPSTIFFKIILPLSKPGLIAGCILVFFPAMTLFYIPDLLGGAKSLLLGNLIQQQFLTSHNWPFGSALSIVLTCIMCLFIIVTRAKQHRELL